MHLQRLTKLAEVMNKLPDDAIDMNEWLKTSQGDWIDAVNARLSIPDNQRETWCGTTGCIAGWAIALFGDADEWNDLVYNQGALRAVADYAQQLLELDDDEADHIFMGKWAYWYDEHYEDYRTPDLEFIPADTTRQYLHRVIADPDHNVFKHKFEIEEPVEEPA